MSLYKISISRKLSRNTLSFLIFSSALILSLSAKSQSFLEGTHYTMISNGKPSTDNEVVEYFSLSCPGCFALEPKITELLDARPQTNFRQVHMPFGGRNAKFSQKAFALTRLLKAEKHISTIFSRIHVERNAFNDDDEIIDFFGGLGYEQNNVEEMASSFTADTLIRKMNKQGEDKGITSVPTIIINDKYQVNLRQLGPNHTLVDLIDYLTLL